MGRAPCCDKANVKKGPWSPEEDTKLKEYIEKHGTGGNWIALPQKSGLRRCGKSCRLRWLNYLRPNIKHGEFSDDEDRIICTLFATIGSRWSIMAAQLPGRTDNDIKNYWNTKLKKKLMGLSSNNFINPLSPQVISRNFKAAAAPTAHFQQTLIPSSPSTSSSSLYKPYNLCSSSSISNYPNTLFTNTSLSFHHHDQMNNNIDHHNLLQSQDDHGISSRYVVDVGPLGSNYHMLNDSNAFHLHQQHYHQQQQQQKQQASTCSSSDGSTINSSQMINTTTTTNIHVDYHDHQYDRGNLEGFTDYKGPALGLDGNCEKIQGYFGNDQSSLDYCSLEEIKQLISTNLISTGTFVDENKAEEEEEKVIMYY